MKIFQIHDVPRFFTRILGCEGYVYYRDEEGQCHDLKEIARQFLGCKRPFRSEEIGEIDLIVERAEDCMRLYHYALEAR